jgi:hypothetical protein
VRRAVGMMACACVHDVLEVVSEVAFEIAFEVVPEFTLEIAFETAGTLPVSYASSPRRSARSRS